MKGGGKAAIIYNRADESSCAPVLACLTGPGCDGPAAKLIPAVGIARAQGEAIRALISSGKAPNATIAFVNASKQAQLVFLSSGRLAVVQAAGVAGIVWSANPLCTNAEIRAALRASSTAVGTDLYDNEVKFGMVQAKAALDHLAKRKCKAYIKG
jgi:hypothetical protein